MRRLITFASKGETLVGTLDLPNAPASVGVLIVSGGNEVRAGAHRGMALLAAELAADGLAVLRFDRAGVGDSTGENRGFQGSKHDIHNAALVHGNETGVEVIVGFGNCDAASALALFGREVGIDAAVFANPWLGKEPDALPPPAAIRARYAERLADPASWRRLFSGGVDVRKLAGGVAKLLRPQATQEMSTTVVQGIADWGTDVTVVLATGDATAQAFRHAAHRYPFRTYEVDTASHSFAGEANRQQLRRIITQSAERLRAELDRLTT